MGAHVDRTSPIAWLILCLTTISCGLFAAESDPPSSVLPPGSLRDSWIDEYKPRYINSIQDLNETPSDATCLSILEVDRDVESTLTRFEKLRFLELRFGTLSGPALARLLSHPCLECLVVDNCDAPSIANGETLKVLVKRLRIGSNLGVLRALLGSQTAQESLLEIDLRHCHAGDLDIEYLAKCQSLYAIDASYNTRLSRQAIRKLFMLPARALFLNGVELGDEHVPDEVAHSTIEHLSLGAVPGLNDSILQQLAKMQSLRVLLLESARANTRVTDKGIASITSLKHLTFLGLPAAKLVSAEGLRTVAKMNLIGIAGGLDILASRSKFEAVFSGGSYQAVSLWINPTSIPGDCMRLLGQHTIRQLSITFSDRITDHLDSLPSFKRLEELTVCGLEVDDRILQLIGKVPKLSSLAIGGESKFTGAGLRCLAGVPHLTSLSLTYLPALGRGEIEVLYECPSLRELVIGNSVHISKDVLIGFKKLRLRRLRIAGVTALSANDITVVREELGDCIVEVFGASR